MANISNLYIDQGSDYSSVITVTAANGLPLNLTGYTAKSQLRKSYSSSQAYNFTCDIVDAAAGKLRIQMTAAYTETIAPGRWLYDVEITQMSSGKKKRVVEGIATITPQITQV